MNESATDPARSGLLRALRRRRAVVLLVLAVVPLSALAVSLFQEKQYTASASLLFRDPRLDAKLFESSILEPSTDPSREAQTNVRLVSLDAVADRTAARLGHLSGDDVSEKVDVSPAGQSDVVAIKATDPKPGVAADLANTFAREYIAFRREADRSTIREALGLVERQLRALPASERTERDARSLKERARELQVLAALQTGNAELVQRAEKPTSASSPEPVRNTLVAGVLGLLLGVGLALILDRLDRRLKDPREVEEIFGRPILGMVPESRALSTAAEDSNRLPAAEAEAFRMLRANLRYFDVSREIRSVVVTSATPGEGKSTVAWNLAAAAAEAGARVLLVEADLRHPSLARRHDLPAERGLTTVLSERATSAEAASRVTLQGQAANGAGPSFDALLAGPLPPNPTDLIESERMADLLASASKDYDLVVIDTPPTTVVSDAIPLVKQVSGVIVVSRFGQTTRDAAAHLHRQLEHLDAPTLGVVVNAVGDEGGGYYGYGYAYGYGDSEAAALETASGGVDEQASAPVEAGDGKVAEAKAQPDADTRGLQRPITGASEVPPQGNDSNDAGGPARSDPDGRGANSLERALSRLRRRLRP